MLQVVDERALAEYCFSRGKLKGKILCESCRYRASLLTGGDGCIFSKQPFELLGKDDPRQRVSSIDGNDRIIDHVQRFPGEPLAKASRQLGVSISKVQQVKANLNEYVERRNQYPEFYEAAKKLGVSEGYLTTILSILERRGYFKKWPNKSLRNLVHEQGIGALGIKIVEEARALALEKGDV